MFLKTLTLRGFKSFAHKTVLEFEPGLTVVVGPNGSGKSNLVDAVAWVLGAQGPSTVRSGKMDDVIFAGTAERPALGRAEVSLTIDNSSGLLPIELSDVEITRTLFRTGESEYSLNAAPCRLLDISELLSDAGVGRHQHVIVSQGEVDAVLNASPEGRRAMVEEAAGILKYRQRKEKAERRLEATEGSLVRLHDLLREVRRQLKPLERQADAARRHGALEVEMRAIRLFLIGREIGRHQTKLHAVGRERREQSERERGVRSRLSELDASVAAAEQLLSHPGDDDLDDAMVRVEALRERARGLAALVAEKRRGVDELRRDAADAGLVESLVAEAVDLRSRLADLDREEESLDAMRAECSEAERGVADAEDDYERAVRAAGGGDDAREAELRAEARVLEVLLAQAGAQAEALTGRQVEVGSRLRELEVEIARLGDEVTAAEAQEPSLREAMEAARSAREIAERRLAEAEEARRAADAEAHRRRARAEALAQALDETRAAAHARHVEGVDGVLGPLVDLIEVEPGAEQAVGGALGEAMRALVVRDGDSARAAVERLEAGDAGGLLLVAGATGGGVQGRLVPPGARPLADCVRARTPELSGALQALLAGVVIVEGGWAEALDLALEHPALTVVTRAGDRFVVGSPWRVGGSHDAGVSPTAVEQARGEAVVAEAAQREAEHQWDAAREDFRTWLDEDRTRAAAHDACVARRASAAEALHRAGAERARTGDEAQALADQVDDLGRHATTSRRRLAQVRAHRSGFEGDGPGCSTIDSARQALDATRAAATGLTRRVERAEAATGERRALLEARLAEIDARLEGKDAARRQAEARAAGLARRAAHLAALDRQLGDHREAVERVHGRLDSARRARIEARHRASDRLDQLRHERAERERLLDETRERLRRLEVDEAEVGMRLESAVDTVRRDFDCEPDAAVAAEAPELPEGVTPAARTRELERELRTMGPVNPLALEEFEALRERHGFLEEQLDDVKETRRDLRKIIRAVDGQITEVFAAAFADVELHFADLVAGLFPGGSGSLNLTEPDHLLDTGIEIEARPSGKSVRRLSLLSGGERSLVALAFLFAIFRARPSPFYLLDEVDAALDDVNLHRFLELVDEFRTDAQMVIVTHQKRTMEAADVLYGVSMPPGGSSVVVSERLGPQERVPVPWS